MQYTSEGTEGVEGEGGLLNNVLQREASPRGPSSYLSIYFFFKKRYHFLMPFLGKW